MNKYKEVYILGIGGSGMSSIAKYLVQQNIDVAGYDQRKSFITNQLNHCLLYTSPSPRDS